MSNQNNNYSQLPTDILDTLIQDDLQPGIYEATIPFFKTFPATTNTRNEIIRDSFIEVSLRIQGRTEKARWYAKRLPYIMRCLRTQLGDSYQTYKLSDLLALAAKVPFNVELSYDPTYGAQYDYLP